MTWKIMLPALGICISVATGHTAERSMEHLAIGTLKDGQQTQEMVEAWDDEGNRLQQQIAEARAALETLTLESDQLDRALDSEKKEIAEFHRRKVETERLRSGLQRWLQTVLLQLQESRDTSLPFLPEERENRLQELNALLLEPGHPLHEKFRRTFEALQVETEYGFTSEVYRDEITLEGQKVVVDLLRVGRLALLFRSLDQKRAGFFNPATQEFQAMEEGVPEIGEAFRVVRGEVAAKMVMLPVGRIRVP